MPLFPVSGFDLFISSGNIHIPSFLPLHDISPSLQTWVAELYSDLLAPLQTLSLGLLIGGIVLLVVSFVYKPRVVEE